MASTGGVITSAGIVLAAVFAVLGVLPLITLTQLGIVVGIGILLDTFVVRTVVIPALFTLIGRRIWWPARVDPQVQEAVYEVLPLWHNRNRLQVAVGCPALALSQLVTPPIIMRVYGDFLSTGATNDAVITPAGYAFSIWGLITLLCAITFVGRGARRARCTVGEPAARRRLGGLRGLHRVVADRRTGLDVAQRLPCSR